MSIIVSVAPNGGWLSKLDHPRLPLSIAELAEEARACSAAGARLMHFHVRGTHGEHSLDAGLYREALREIEPHADGMVLQISSESRGVGKNLSKNFANRNLAKDHPSKDYPSKDYHSVGDDALYSPHQQAQCIFASNCAAASVSFREICSEGSAFARGFYAEAAARGIHLQHILYSVNEAESFQRALTAGIVVQARGHRLCVLFVFGRDAARAQSDAASFSAFIASCLRPFGEDAPLWFVCAFGEQEQARLIQASLLSQPRLCDDSPRSEYDSRLSIGSGVRLGFENNLYAQGGGLVGLSDGGLDGGLVGELVGELAETNAAQVLSFARAAEARGIDLASQEQTNAQFGFA